MKPDIYELISMNVGSKKIRALKKILIIGSCIINEYSAEIYQDIAKDHVVLHVCMESYHFNMISLKIASILARIPIKELIILTVDGSPHCVQLHTAVEEAVKITNASVVVKHFVIEKNRLIEISNKAIKYSRYLSKIDKLLKKSLMEET